MAPTSGRNIQSLQMVDIDGDGQDEALAFFRLSNGEKPLKIYVFHPREDSYELASIIESSGTAIDSIYYEDSHRRRSEGADRGMEDQRRRPDRHRLRYAARPGAADAEQLHPPVLSGAQRRRHPQPSAAAQPTATTSRWRSFAAGRRGRCPSPTAAPCPAPWRS